MISENRLVNELMKVHEMYPDSDNAIDIAVRDLAAALETSDPHAYLMKPAVRAKLRSFQPNDAAAYSKALRAGLYTDMADTISNPGVLIIGDYNEARKRTKQPRMF